MTPSEPRRGPVAGISPTAAADGSYSVLMAVYSGDRVDWFRAAVESMERQTVPPSAFVIVRDGPVGPDISNFLDELDGRPGFRIVRLDENRGLAEALAEGLSYCDTEFVARMDADDISAPTRMEVQLPVFDLNPDVALVGAWYAQFDSTMQHQVGVRRVPQHHPGIRRMASTRTPINHVTAVFRNAAAREAGGYGGAALYFEDWWLTWRLLSAGHLIHNVPACLVDVRGGSLFVERRHGLSYARREWDNLVGLWREGHLTLGAMLRTALYRIPPRLLPRRVLQFVYESVLRRGDRD